MLKKKKISTLVKKKFKQLHNFTQISLYHEKSILKIMCTKYKIMFYISSVYELYMYLIHIDAVLQTHIVKIIKYNFNL